VELEVGEAVPVDEKHGVVVRVDVQCGYDIVFEPALGVLRVDEPHLRADIHRVVDLGVVVRLIREALEGHAVDRKHADQAAAHLRTTHDALTGHDPLPNLALIHLGYERNDPAAVADVAGAGTGS
jgi:hypothetical protein